MPRKRNNVRVDDAGLVQFTADAPWRPDHGRSNTRRGLPWSPAEDALLLRRVRELAADPVVDDPVRVIAEEIGRGPCAVTTRLSALRAGIRLAALAGLRDVF